MYLPMILSPEKSSPYGHMLDNAYLIISITLSVGLVS